MAVLVLYVAELLFVPFAIRRSPGVSQWVGYNFIWRPPEIAGNGIAVVQWGYVFAELIATSFIAFLVLAGTRLRSSVSDARFPLFPVLIVYAIAHLHCSFSGFLGNRSVGVLGLRPRPQPAGTRKRGRGRCPPGLYSVGNDVDDASHIHLVLHLDQARHVAPLTNQGQRLDTQRSALPRFSVSSLFPLTMRSPRLTCVSTIIVQRVVSNAKSLT